MKNVPVLSIRHPGGEPLIDEMVVGRFLSCSYRYLTVISLCEMAGVTCTYENWHRQLLFQGVYRWNKRERFRFTSDSGGPLMEKYESVIKRPVNRRSLLKSGLLAGVAAVVGAGTGLFSGAKSAFGQDSGGGL